MHFHRDVVLKWRKNPYDLESYYSNGIIRNANWSTSPTDVPTYITNYSLISGSIPGIRPVFMNENESDKKG